MKKIIALALVCVSVAASLAACGGKFTCDACGEEKTGKKETMDMFGIKMTVCADCMAEANEALGGLGGLM